MRFLVVDDERAFADFVREGLRRDDCEVDVAADGPEGIALASKKPYDLILLDVGLPTLGGLEVCRRLRDAGSKVPILMLTALDTVADKVKGLEGGADDYLTKPFALEELRARVNALLRRRDGEGAGSIVRVADLTLDAARHEVRRGDRVVDLTAKEFALLEFLMRRPGRVVTRDQIRDSVWDGRAGSANIVDVFIRRLRRKIDRPPERPIIRTVRGVGYQLKG